MDRESYLPPVQIGEPMRAGCVAQVVKSNHPDFSAGQMVQATNGWQDYAVVDPAHPPSSLRAMPEGAPPEMMLSVLGVTGLMAYFGLLDLGDPQPGETVLDRCGGGHRQVAGQIAKIKGCRVVGIAGGPEKCAVRRRALTKPLITSRATSTSRSPRPAPRSGTCSSTTWVVTPSRRR